jgi:hypothetical protein
MKIADRRNTLFYNVIYLSVDLLYCNCILLIAVSRNRPPNPPAYYPPPAAGFYAAPPPAYEPPHNSFYAWVPYDTFPTAPPCKYFTKTLGQHFKF